MIPKPAFIHRFNVSDLQDGEVLDNAIKRECLLMNHEPCLTSCLVSELWKIGQPSSGNTTYIRIEFDSGFSVAIHFVQAPSVLSL